MKCKKCGAEIPSNAKYCDICGAKVVRQTYRQRAAEDSRAREKARKKQRLTRVVIAAAAVIAVCAFWRIIVPVDIHRDPNLYLRGNRVTAEEYGKLSEGMTYKQVRKIIGRGALKTSLGTRSIGATYYVWPGEYIDRKLQFEASVTVDIDHSTKKVAKITEQNVIDGEEIHANLTSGRKAMTERTEDELDSGIKKGMSYGQVAGFLGIDGLLCESSSDSDGEFTRVYEWYYYNWIGDKAEIHISFKNGKADYIYIG